MSEMSMPRRASTVHIGCHPQNLSFSGCGFLGVYHIGVACCFKQHSPKFLASLKRIYGCSAGSIIGALLLCDVCTGEICRSTLEIVRDVRSRFLGPLSPGFRANQVLLDGFRRVLPPDAHKRCHGKLHISLTRVSDMKNIIVSEYPTRNELINALLCSSFVPFYSGFVPPKYCGVYYVDGGLTNNLPAGSDTITVSPWSGGSDICPRDDSAISLLDVNIVNTSVQMTVRNLHRVSTMFFPPEGDKLADFCKQGFREALQYLKEHGLFETINPSLRSMSFSSELEEVYSKESPRHRLSMSSKWAELQSLSDMPITELEWEEEDTDSVKSGSDYLTMNLDCSPDISYDSDIHDSDKVCDEKLDKFDANHNQEMDDITSESLKMCLEENPHLRSLPVTSIVQIPTTDLGSMLNHTLPQSVLLAFEEAYRDKNNRWHGCLTKIVSLCGKPLMLTKLPLEKAYSIAVFFMNNAAHVPSDLKWLLQHVSDILNALQENFQAKGADLVRKLQNTKDSLSDDLKLLFWQLCIVLQILVQKLLSNRQTLNLSWVLKLAQSLNSFSKFSGYLSL